MQSNAQLDQHLVSTCPFIPFDLMKVALRLLEHLSKNVSFIVEGRLRLELGTGLCYVGQHPEPLEANDLARTDPVMFLACPSLDVETPESLRSNGNQTSEIGPQSLLNILYGYDVGVERERQQIIQKMATNRSDQFSLQVRQTWMLRIGHHILITLSNQDLKAHLGENLRIDDGISKIEGKISVRLQSPIGHWYSITLDRNTKYADFHKHAVMLSTGGDRISSFIIIDSESGVLNETNWPRLMSTSGVNAPRLQVVRATSGQNFHTTLALPAPRIQIAPKRPTVEKRPLSGQIITVGRNKSEATSEPSKLDIEQGYASSESGYTEESDVAGSLADSDSVPDSKKLHRYSVGDTRRITPIITPQPAVSSQTTTELVRDGGASSIQAQGVDSTADSRRSPTTIRQPSSSNDPGHDFVNSKGLVSEKAHGSSAGESRPREKNTTTTPDHGKLVVAPLKSSLLMIKT